MLGDCTAAICWRTDDPALCLAPSPIVTGASEWCCMMHGEDVQRGANAALTCR